MENPSQGTQGRKLKRRKALKETVDQISSLPDALLLHILSFLKMNDVTKTTLLSKRWRYLWVYATCLDFDFYFGSDTKRMITFIDRSIIGHEGSKVQKFHLNDILRDCRALQIDSWIRFAIRRHVEELALEFCWAASDYHQRELPYKVPHSVFNCTSLTTLLLSFCDLNLPASMHLPSLKKLVLVVLYIPPDAIKRLTSNCPLLEELVLDGCNADLNLDIDIENQNLKSLDIYDYCFTWGTQTEVIICAPYLVSLSFHYNIGREKYCLENLLSLVKASFHDLDNEQLYGEEFHGYEWARLLGDLHHVKELNIRSAFIGGLAAWELRKLNSFPINATHIQLDSDFRKWDLPGISYLLRNSSKLEDLTIRPRNGETKFCPSFKDQFGFEERGLWESNELDFSSAMQNLKTVKIYLCSGTNEQGDVDNVHCDFENMFEFVKFVFKNSQALERITLTIGRNNKPSRNYKLLFKFTEKLIRLLPRASSKAEIHII